MCEFDWDIISKYLAPILAFFAGFIPVYFAGERRAKELKEELTTNNKFRKIELDHKKAEFIYNQKHKGYEDLLKIISKYSIETRDLIFEDFLLVVFEFNFKKNELDSYSDEELELFYEEYREKFSSISKKYNDLHQLLNIEIQPSILNSSNEVYELIENLKNSYNLIFKKFNDDYLPKLTTLTMKEMKKHNDEIKVFSLKYQLSFDQLKIQMRKEIKEEESKIHK